MEKFRGFLRKMAIKAIDSIDNQAEYHLVVDDLQIPINQYLDQAISINFLGNIKCLACEKYTNKSFNQGYCYRCFIKLACCDSCIMSPQKCHYHLGTCRQPTWGEQNCFIPHYLYLSNTSGPKVGLTRATQIPTRWLDQGATQAVAVMEVSDRRQAGLCEVLAKKFIADKTNWRAMLRGENNSIDLLNIWEELKSKINFENKNNFIANPRVVNFNYPVIKYPSKINSFDLEKNPNLTGRLYGMKGQYLILDHAVINLRKYTGYEVEIIL